MAKVLVHTNTSRLNQLTRERESLISDLSEILNDFNALDIGELTGDDLAALVADPKGFVFDKMNDGNPIEVGGIAISKSKAMELVSFPAGYPALDALIASFKANRKDSVNVYMYEIVDGEIEVKAAVTTADQESCKTYISDDQKPLHDFITDVLAAANTRFNGKKKDIGTILSALVAPKLESDVQVGYTIRYDLLGKYV